MKCEDCLLNGTAIAYRNSNQNTKGKSDCTEKELVLTKNGDYYWLCPKNRNSSYPKIVGRVDGQGVVRDNSGQYVGSIVL